MIVRHRTREAENSPFSARNFRDFSSGAVAAPCLPEGFADTVLPVFSTTIAQNIYLSGLFAPPALCSGIGRCGLCRVRFLSDPPKARENEANVLSAHDIESGWRLSCCHAPAAGMHILIPALPAPAARSIPPARESSSRKGSFALAVDLGTTSIHWRLVPVNGTGDFTDDAPGGSMINPQMGAGSEVISRLAYAEHEGGTEILRNLVTRALAFVVDGCAAEGYPIIKACIAANPAITGILLGLDTSCLTRAPYSLPLSGNTLESAPGLPPLYIPPQISPFVGGDISAGYATLALNPDGPDPEFPFLLADLGTNGECLLALSPTEALAASLPMGPALEGVNLSFGCTAAPGAVTDYTMTPYGIEPVVLGETAPIGITATGYLSLLRILRASGVIGEDGLFIRDAKGSRLTRTAEDEGSVPGIRLPGKMFLYASDVEEILKVKAAFTLAVSSLLRAASIPASRLRRVFLAGSLGANVSLAALSGLGFLPSGVVSGSKTVLAGNTSLAGAVLFLRNDESRKSCAVWAKSVTTLDLASDPTFGEEFARQMVFTWRA